MTAKPPHDPGNSSHRPRPAPSPERSQRSEALWALLSKGWGTAEGNAEGALVPLQQYLEYDHIPDRDQWVGRARIPAPPESQPGTLSLTMLGAEAQLRRFGGAAHLLFLLRIEEADEPAALGEEEDDGLPEAAPPSEGAMTVELAFTSDEPLSEGQRLAFLLLLDPPIGANEKISFRLDGDFVAFAVSMTGSMNVAEARATSMGGRQWWSAALTGLPPSGGSYTLLAQGWHKRR